MAISLIINFDVQLNEGIYREIIEERQKAVKFLKFNKAFAIDKIVNGHIKYTSHAIS